MPIASEIRAQILATFRAELNEHLQVMNDGLLAIEQDKLDESQRLEVLEKTFRAAHSLKGAARAMGVTAIEELAHALENTLTALRTGALAPSGELFSACYAALDAIQMTQAGYEAKEGSPPPQALKALQALEPFRPAAPPSSSETEPEAGLRAPGREATTLDEQSYRRPAKPAPEAEKTVRIQIDKLDSLMGSLNELMLSRLRAHQRLEQIRRLHSFSAAWLKDWQNLRQEYNHLQRQEENGWLARSRLRPVEAEWLSEEESGSPPNKGEQGLITLPDLSESHSWSEFEHNVIQLLHYSTLSQQHLSDLNNLAGELLRQASTDESVLALSLDEMEEEIKRLRMLPFDTICTPFARMVRDLARQTGKEAYLQIEGSQTEIDRSVLERIKDPLIHLLRNAVDHGIETPEQRRALGKPPAGKVHLKAEQNGGEVHIQISDDGAGLNIEAIRQLAVRQGRPEAQALSETELADWLFHSGISTKQTVTALSGRGMGLSIVRRNLEDLRGRANVTWQPGHGTTFTMTLSQALTGTHGLFVHAGGQLLAIPLTAVEHIISCRTEEVITIKGRPAVRSGEQIIPLVRLDKVLGLARSRETGTTRAGTIVALILTNAGMRVAFEIDQLSDEQEIIIKGLGRMIRHLGGISGVTITGNGAVVPVLNPGELILLAKRQDQGLEAEAPPLSVGPYSTPSPANSILVVDDSITTRTLEKNILETAGYKVQVATNGQEAFEMLKASIGTRNLPNLVVADIVMPLMDGFELTRRIRGSHELSGVPIILVTSLNSPQDKARGIEVGADAYIVKSSFDQDNLLASIKQLL